MKSALLLVFLFLGISVFGQEYIADEDLRPIPVIELPQLSNQELVKAELEKRSDSNRPPEFARVCKVDAGCHETGKWTEVNGRSIWQMVVESKGAESLNFGFSEFYLPSSASFYLIGANSGLKRGPFVSADNEPHDQFWSPLIEDDKVVLQLEVNSNEKEHVRLHLAKTNHGFMKFGSQGVSGACNLDVICANADGWGINDSYRDIIRSVVMYSLNGSQQCTGMLINNVREDFTPYIITADHCNVSPANASSFVAYYNYENSICRQPNSTASGQNGNGSLGTFNSGAIWISATTESSGTDFNLLQLDDPINPSANAFLSGWNRADEVPSSAISIHHPNTAEKRISHENDPLQISENGGISPNPNGRYLRVIDWDTGTTEAGSSGSPIFDSNKRFIGQLFGGTAACGNNESDYYGRLAISWEGGGSATTRVKDYLDPDEIELFQTDGIEANQMALLSSPDAYHKEVCKPNNLSFTINTSTNFVGPVSYSVVSNSGSATVDFQPALINPGDATTANITNVSSISPGLQSLRIKIEDGNGNAIELPLWYEVRDAMNNDITLESPNDGSEFQIPTPKLKWIDINADYEVEVSTDNTFALVVASVANLTSNEWFVDLNLNPNTEYFWRVRATTICAIGDWSTTYSFTTGTVPECQTFVSTDVPKTLIVATANIIESTLVITDPGQISKLRVSKIKGQHTWISDLAFTLTSPAGTAVELLSNACNDENNFDIGFDDAAATGAVECPYNNGAIYQPLNPLSEFIGEFASGTWTLRVSDNADDDGGSLDEWSLEVCTVTNPNIGITASVDTLDVCSSVNTTVNITPGTGFTNTVTLSVESITPGLDANLSQTSVAPGTLVDLTLNGSISSDLQIVVSATDGIVIVNKSIYLRLTESPDAASLSNPANLAEDIPIITSLTWSTADNADSYRYELASDNSFSSIISTATGADLSVDLMLDEATNYFWRVLAINECDTTYSEIRSFETGNRFGFTILEDTIVTCQSTVAYKVILESGFIGNTIATLSDAPSGATVSYENNPGQLMDTIVISLSDIPSLKASYDMTLSLVDDLGSTMQPLELIVEIPPGAPDLVFPPNNEADVDTLPTLMFDLGINGTSHNLQIATEATFDNIVVDIDDLQSGTIALNEKLQTNTTYFWRVSAINSCGISFSTIYQFITMIGTGIDDVFESESIRLAPNPTSGNTTIAIETNGSISGEYQLMGINGQILMSGKIRSNQTIIPTASLAKGIYMVKINDDKSFIVRKLIIF